MDENQFIGLVAQRVGMSSQQANALVQATLTTLAERIDGGEARDLAGQLPEGLRAYAFGASETAERFDLAIFLQRISERAGVDPTGAKDGATAVFDVLREAVPSDAYDDVVSQLPAEFGDVADLTAPFVERTR